MAGLILDGADDLVVLRQVALESGDGGVGVGQLLLDRPSLLERCKGFGEMSGLLLHVADVVMALCQATLELRVRGVSVGQLLADGPCSRVRLQGLGGLAARWMEPMSW